MSKSSWFALVVAMSLSSVACVVGSTRDQTHTVPGGTAGTSSGTLTITWTVSGSTDPYACYDIYADSLEILLADSGGSYDPIVAPCSDFIATIELADGTYDAALTLIDTANHSVSDTLHLSSLVIRSGTDLTSDTSF